MKEEDYVSACNWHDVTRALVALDYASEAATVEFSVPTRGFADERLTANSHGH